MDKWSEKLSPSKEIPYDHVMMETPLGKAVIEWKGWKQHPSYTVYIGETYIDEACYCESLEEAKKLVITFLQNASLMLTEFLNRKIDG